jgi:hypothetical protein
MTTPAFVWMKPRPIQNVASARDSGWWNALVFSQMEATSTKDRIDLLVVVPDVFVFIDPQISPVLIGSSKRLPVVWNDLVAELSAKIAEGDVNCFTLPFAGTLVNDSTDTAFDCGDTVDYQLGFKMLATQLFRRKVWEADIVKVAFE